ncbi:hypothetical protein EIKCOROL_01010 [Eikenella corrodens ATCC 23834]|uniref:Uncharacterized protein n=1 Tax=Eikenella corrodens ATCC 23834 TaxID=546274 RepID=C0DUH8_EIKCO|nr:hypothetical protein EIKCOROL_01010 [Eikenella corrodens ATCC 23834]
MQPPVYCGMNTVFSIITRHFRFIQAWHSEPYRLNQRLSEN